MVKGFLIAIGWILLFLVLINIAILVFNTFNAWLGIAIGVGSVIGAICLLMFYWGKWCFIQEGKKSTNGIS